MLAFFIKLWYHIQAPAKGVISWIMIRMGGATNGEV